MVSASTRMLPEGHHHLHHIMNKKPNNLSLGLGGALSLHGLAYTKVPPLSMCSSTLPFSLGTRPPDSSFAQCPSTFGASLGPQLILHF